MRVLLVLIGLLAFPVMAAELGDDGLHKADWMQDTFKDLAEDLADANDEGQAVVLFFEQRGCIYCTKMHEEVFPRPEITSYISDNFFVVQLNLHGDVEVTDFDGEILSEKQMARKWNVLFTPTLMFMPEEVGGAASPTGSGGSDARGLWAGHNLDMFTWVNEKRYEDQSEEDFQRYHARRIQERNDGSTD